MKKLLILGSVILLGMSISIFGQECGPGCPICSGSGNSTGALLSSGSTLASFLSIPGGEEENGVMNFRAGINSWLDMGLGYTIKAKKPLWSIRLQILKEVESSFKPSLILGTGSVQTGKSDQSLFFYVSKSVDLNELISARLSVGGAGLIPELDKAYFLSTLTLTITENWSPFINYDGRNFHYGLSFIPADWFFVGLLMVESKSPSILIGTRWNLRP